MTTTTKRLQRLRELMKEQGIDFYVIPTDDAHHTEYVADADKRREFISGFTGSAGQAIITAHEAFLLTDSRFWVQAEEELDDNWQLGKVRSAGLPLDWVEWILPRVRKACLGFDPTTISVQDVRRLEVKLRKHGSSIVYPRQNLVDAIWDDRPLKSDKPVFIHPIEFAGEDTKSKLSRVRKWIEDQESEHGEQLVGTLITSLPEVAYILNLRGSDIEYNPLFHAYLFVGISRATVFLDSVKVTSDIDKYLQDAGVERREYDEVGKFLELREWDNSVDGGKASRECSVFQRRIGLTGRRQWQVAISPQTSIALADALGEPSYLALPSEVERMKAIKNDTEIEGLKTAYLTDGFCFTRFLAHLDQQITIESREVTEWEAARQLDGCRQVTVNYRGLASENISATGPNAALPHYMPSKEKALVIGKDTPYLNDSGGQYLNGTCDTTRTIHFGNPTDEQREAYTRVLQGHIAIDTAVFPEGTTGLQLDALARRTLWKDGLNYGHGSGHGFGSFLMTHEGPQGFGIDYPFVPGHVVTNEPGFYKEKDFGVRIESALFVKRVETKYQFNGNTWLGFERLTCVPIHTTLVNPGLLTSEEKQWLKEHNETCLKILAPYFKWDEITLKWVEREAERARRIACDV